MFLIHTGGCMDMSVNLKNMKITPSAIHDKNETHKGRRQKKQSLIKRKRIRADVKRKSGSFGWYLPKQLGKTKISFSIHVFCPI